MSKKSQQNQQAQLFASRLQELRLNIGWSASELARQAEMGRDNICCYEKGKCLPNSKHLSKLSKALGVSPSYLISEDKIKLDFEPQNQDEELEFKQIHDRPGFVKLKISKEVPFEKAIEILNILQK